MGFIVSGVSSRRVKYINTETYEQPTVYYSHQYRYSKTIPTEKRITRQSELQEHRLRKKNKQNTVKTNHVLTHTHSQFFQNYECQTPKTLLDLPTEIVDKIFVYSGRDSSVPLLNKKLYRHCHVNLTSDFHTINHYIKVNYTEYTENGMIFDQRVFNCCKTRDYLMYIGMTTPLDDDKKTNARRQCLEFLFDQPIVNCTNNNSNNITASQHAQIYEQEFPTFFLRNTNGLNKFFMPFLYDSRRNAIFDYIINKSQQRVHIRTPDLFINTLIRDTYPQVYGIENISVYFSGFYQMWRNGTPEVHLQLSSHPITLAIETVGKNSNMFRELWSPLLKIYTDISNLERLSDDEVWYLLVSDPELVVPYELIWEAGGRPSATVMNNV